MSGEKGNFRSRIFGGFDRQDVATYIERLSAERNELKSRCGELERKLEETTEQLRAAEENADEEARKAAEFKLSVVEDAVQQIEQLELKHKEVSTDMNVTVEHVKGELQRAGDNLTLMKGVFESLSDRFTELKAEARSAIDAPEDSEPETNAEDETL